MSHISTPWARARALVALVAVAVGVAPLSAHDLWIEASAFRPDPGRVVGLHLRVGQDFLGDPIPRDPTLIEQFVAITPDRTSPIVGQDGADPAGLLRQVTPALVVVAYRSRSTAITLPPEKFNQYLRDEGLDDVARMRAERKQDHDPARELFARCAKALLQTGAALLVRDRSGSGDDAGADSRTESLHVACGRFIERATPARAEAVEGRSRHRAQPAASRDACGDPHGCEWPRDLCPCPKQETG